MRRPCVVFQENPKVISPMPNEIVAMFAANTMTFHEAGRLNSTPVQNAPTVAAIGTPHTHRETRSELTGNDRYTRKDRGN